MTLSFSTQINGKPNWFIEKVWKGLLENKICSKSEYLDFLSNDDYEANWAIPPFEIMPKIHTIREDKNNRWKASNTIHPVINNRTPNRFQFAPEFKCISTQEIEICYSRSIGNDPITWIDGRHIYLPEIYKLAVNDGFEDTFEFFNYFNHDFIGKIIHFTDLKY